MNGRQLPIPPKGTLGTAMTVFVLALCVGFAPSFAQFNGMQLVAWITAGVAFAVALYAGAVRR
jgi:hypothetical protein